jgi:hypothetical protein
MTVNVPAKVLTCVAASGMLACIGQQQGLGFP